MNLLELKNISKIYNTEAGETVAVDDVSLAIAPGEFVAIMGPSGSGKSTLMHILGLLDRPSKGVFLLKNEDVTTLSDDELAQARNKEIGFVFQAFNLLPKTSVYENVELPLLYADQKIADKKARIFGALESVGMGHRTEFSSNQLSGGEKQRVAIARALVNNPSLVFADEPTGNLDSKSGKQVMQILQDLNNKGVTVVLVTHEKNTALHAKRMLRMQDGKLVSDEEITNRIIAEKEGELAK
jgi:putative ABC transport system ATP-binding protein